MLRKIPLLFFLWNMLVFCSLTSFAQEVHRAVIINSDKGLSQNSVYSICKDSKGFLWVGTGDGLNRYDGNEFIVFRNSSRQKSSLNGYSLNYTMYEDEKQRLWFSTERNLVCFDQRRRMFQDIVPFGNIGNKFIVSLDSAENTIWFIQAGLGLFSYNYEDDVFEQFQFPMVKGRRNQFSDSHGADDGKGNIWVTTHAGLLRFTKKGKAWKEIVGQRNFSEICIDRGGMIWLLNRDSIYTFNSEKGQLSILKNPKERSGPYYSMTPDDKNNVWIGTLSGNLFRANSVSNEIMFAGNLPSLTGAENVKELRCIFYDPAGVLWIGTEGGGVIKIDLAYDNFKTFPTPQSHIPTIFIKSLYSENDSLVWIGTFKKWIYRFNPYTREVSRLAAPKGKTTSQLAGGVYSIVKDHEGILWIGYDGTLIGYNAKTQQFFLHPLPATSAVSNPIINQIRVEGNDLIIATTNGVFRAKTLGAGREVQFNKIFLYPASETLSADDGSFWASSLYKGMMSISTDGSIRKVVAAATGIRCILEDKKHKIIWAATQSGLLAYHIPTEKFRFYDESNGLISIYLYGIVMSGNEIWVSTNKGLAKGSISFGKGEILPEIYFKCYTKEFGLQSDEFNTGAYSKMADGTILFGGINGLNWFKPAEVIANTQKPTVAITALGINDSTYDGTPSAEFLDRIDTDYQANTFLIKFIGIEFHNPQAISYRFKLDGLENKWTAEKAAHEVRYANLPPGHYTFRLYAVNSDGVLSDEVILPINIRPPFYKTWWFITIAFAILVMLIVLITKYVSQMKLRNRIRVLEKEKAIEEERHRISKEMHDDLGAGLTQISLISEAARRRNNNGNFPRKELDDIADTSRQLIENVSEIIWAMNPDFDSLSGMLAYLREQISRLLEYSDKNFKLIIPETYIDRSLSNISRKNIIMLVKEAVNNTIKHSKATEVSVEIRLPGDRLSITVRDNGSGFDISQQYGGNGLKNYRHRAGILDGTVDIRSGESGTIVCFDIPLDK